MQIEKEMEGAGSAASIGGAAWRRRVARVARRRLREPAVPQRREGRRLRRGLARWRGPHRPWASAPRTFLGGRDAGSLAEVAVAGAAVGRRLRRERQYRPPPRLPLGMAAPFVAHCCSIFPSSVIRFVLRFLLKD